MNKAFLLVFLALWSLAAGAQNAAQPAGNDLVVSLYNQLEALQQEVQTLRGIVEEQSYQIRRIEEEQRNRYLDIDRRLQGAAGAATGAPSPINALPGGAGGGSTLPGTNAPILANETPLPPAGLNPNTAGVQPLPSTNGNLPASPGISSTGPAISAASQMDEQELYRRALDLLLDESKYEESISLFQTYINTYPRGRLLANAYYWQGEGLILVSRFDQARNVFMKILSDFPQDPKAAGAMLKLGVVYQAMGNRQLAVQTWREIQSRYPQNLNEIRAAQDYINQ